MILNKNNKPDLGEIVVNHFISSLRTTDGIEPKILLSRQGGLASNTLISMINALSSALWKDTEERIGQTKVSQFIRENYQLPLLVVSKIKKGNIYSEFECNLPLKVKDYPFFTDSTTANNFNESGIYIFRHESGKIAIGSAMNFKRRLTDHLNSFNEHRTMHKLHRFAILNGGINSFSWGPLVITPNFYRLFLSLNPNYVLTKGEFQILVAAEH
uniref:GIY-YIG endonuclease n=1 Tax=Ramaria rubella TaxID=113071 RepID=UPI002238A114|nr:GIY-YIG endonuclease [Ramaria rubella]UYR22225.1 GIY-YIG endonuclease [Ramaria rubella]